ncbi:MAG: hypothetical protein PUG84_00690 [Peptoniphilaceae bacterium]|nr:hypothetical protein [Peptoniphilaceae bacterium]
MEDERKKIKSAMESIERFLKDDSTADIVLRVFKVPSVDEFVKRIILIENSNYDPNLARELLDIDINFFLSLCLIYLKSITKQLLKVQK